MKNTSSIVQRFRAGCLTDQVSAPEENEDAAQSRCTRRRASSLLHIERRSPGRSERGSLCMSVFWKSLSWSCGIEASSWLALKLPSVGTVVFMLLHLPAIALLSHAPKTFEEFWVISPLQMIIWFVIWFLPLKIQERILNRKGHTDG